MTPNYSSSQILLCLGTSTHFYSSNKKKRMETFNNLILLTISQSFRWSGKQKTNTPTDFLTVCLFNEGDERYFNKIYFWVKIRKGGGKILIKYMFSSQGEEKNFKTNLPFHP
jgi:hypothetical protein